MPALSAPAGAGRLRSCSLSSIHMNADAEPRTPPSHLGGFFVSSGIEYTVTARAAAPRSVRPINRPAAKAGEGIRTLDIHVGNVTLYH